MKRTESISIQVHPRDEQHQIDLMQKFRWSLLGSQTLDSTDYSLERRGDTVYHVTTRTHYVKLQFSRDMTFEHDKEIKKLERDFFALKEPEMPEKYPLNAIACIAFVHIWVFYYFLSYKKKLPIAQAELQRVRQRRSEILHELENYE